MSKIDKYEGSTRGERYQEAVIDLLSQILEAVTPKEMVKVRKEEAIIEDVIKEEVIEVIEKPKRKKNTAKK